MITPEFLKTRPLSHSSLTAFKKSPAHYIAYLNEPRVQSAAFLFGDVVDVLLLTPDQFDKRFAIMPAFDRRTTQGKADYAVFCKLNEGKTWIEQSLFDEASYMVAALKSNQPANEKLMEVTDTQLSISWTDKETGLPMISKIDMKAEKWIGDLKTSKDASPDDFIKSVMNFGYYRQAAIYKEAMKYRGAFPDFYFIVAEKSSPFGISVFKADDELLELGLQEYRKLLMEFKFCMENNLWNQTYEFRSAIGYHQLTLPGWAKNKLEQ